MEACGRDPDDLSSMLVVEGDGRLSIKSDAAIRIAEVSIAVALLGRVLCLCCVIDSSGESDTARYQVAAPHPALGAAFEQAARMLLPQAVRDQAYDTVR